MKRVPSGMGPAANDVVELGPVAALPRCARQSNQPTPRLNAIELEVGFRNPESFSTAVRSIH